MRSKLALGVLLLPALLSACGSFPRGAGREREVLARHHRGDEVTGDFAIAPVTRSRLALYAGWPALGDPGYRWIRHVEQPSSRVIAAGDTVTVHLFSTEDNGLLTAPGQRATDLPPIRVGADGSIFLPYVGKLRVAGMSLEHARQKVQEAYVAVTPSAQVQLELSEGRASAVSLIGGVGNPGLYPLVDRGVTVLELIAQAGGVPPTLENPQVRLQRDGHIYGISLQRLLETPSLNTTLRGGDKVYVEADKRYFLSLGAAGREAQVHFPQDRVSALDAMTLIGGLFDARADAKGILILRHYPADAVGPGGPENRRTVFTLDLTSADGLFSAGEFLIQPGDLVYVTESPLSSTSTVIGLLASVFGLANTASTVASRN
jgi:polysaccharide export outer membrane protein